jgi:hypothetical protein
MRVYLTSFFESVKLPDSVEVYSAAVYQPSGYKYPKADWTDIRDQTGKWIRPREFLGDDDPAYSYYVAMLEHYRNRRNDAVAWLESVTDPYNTDIALCCWCPYDKAAQRQLREFGTFICHTGPLGEFLAEELGMDVWYDTDRRMMVRGGVPITGALDQDYFCHNDPERDHLV